MLSSLELYQCTTNAIRIEGTPLFYGPECIPVKDNEIFLPNISLKSGSQYLIEFSKTCTDYMSQLVFK